MPRWPRILAEGVAIIVSILLAFAIQAWWEGRAEERVRVATLQGLLSDFEANQGVVARFLGFNQRIETGNSLLIEALDGLASGMEVTVPDSFLVTAVNAPIVSTSRAALDAALATGRLSVVQSQALREQLARWLQQVDLIYGHELMVRQIVANQVVPLLGRQTSLNDVHAKLPLWLARGRGSEFVSADHTLHGDSELVAVLSHRRFRSGFVVTGQAALLELQEEILSGLRRELAD